MQVFVGERNPYESRQTLALNTKLIDDTRGREEPRLVLSIRGPSLLACLNVVYMYAMVDELSLLPVLLLTNVMALLCAMDELGWI